MDLIDAIAQRHSVRSYTTEPLSAEERTRLQGLVDGVNERSGLSFALVCDEPEAFASGAARYGSFKNVTNYVVCAGKRGHGLAEAVGYHGELLVLEAQAMGLNSCWVGVTFSREAVRRHMAPGSHLVAVIALGHGAGEGSTHPVKPLEKLCSVEGAQAAPAWFERGMWAAQLAPTALNQQRFHISYEGGAVRARALPSPYTDVDLGIVKRHFELAAGRENVAWA